MKLSRLWPVVLLATMTSASAQVMVEVTQDQQQFLPGESLPVAVRVINRSGQQLHFGADAEWLTFTLETRDGRVVDKTGEVPVLGEFDLDSSEVGIKRVDLAPYFALSEQGQYFITATVRIKKWGQEVSSRPHPFDIIQGAKLWEQEVGVPPSVTASNLPPTIRHYILQQANYLRGQLRLYLRVVDEYGRSIKVVPVGPMISFGHPDPPQIDRSSNLHVLYQNGASSFSYTMFNPNGELTIRQLYDYINTRPHLRVDPTGQIAVVGGVRRLTDNDVPPSSPDEDAAAEKAPALTENTPKSAGAPAAIKSKP